MKHIEQERQMSPSIQLVQSKTDIATRTVYAELEVNGEKKWYTPFTINTDIASRLDWMREKKSVVNEDEDNPTYLEMVNANGLLQAQKQSEGFRWDQIQFATSEEHGWGIQQGNQWKELQLATEDRMYEYWIEAPLWEAINNQYDTEMLPSAVVDRDYIPYILQSTEGLRMPIDDILDILDEMYKAVADSNPRQVFIVTYPDSLYTAYVINDEKYPLTQTHQVLYGQEEYEVTVKNNIGPDKKDLLYSKLIELTRIMHADPGYEKKDRQLVLKALRQLFQNTPESISIVKQNIQPKPQHHEYYIFYDFKKKSP